MQLTLNGRLHEHKGDGSIPGLLAEIGARPEHSAVMVNGEVIRRTRWKDYRLNEQDRIEVMTLAAGG